MIYLQMLLNSLKEDKIRLFFIYFFQDTILFLIRAIVFSLILYIGNKICQKLQKYLDKLPVLKKDPGALHFIKSFTKLGINLIFFFLGLLAFGFSEGSVATMISAVSLGIGISLKEFLSNFAGGLVLFFTKPFKIGNFIEVNDVMGDVVKIDIFSTHINGLDSRRIIIPNNVMISGNIINYDSNEVRRIKLLIGVSYDSDMGKVIQTLNEIAKSYPGLDKTKENFINTFKYSDSAIEILFIVWAPTKEYYKTRGELMAHILTIFKQENINIPFNILDVRLAENK